MKKKLKPAIDDDLRPHYNLRPLLRKGVLANMWSVIAREQIT